MQENVELTKKNSAKIVSLRERIGCAVMVLTDNSNYLQ